MNENLSLRQLRAFEAVATEGSFTKAAQRLHLTQSALSVLVRELERELGVTLFDRHTRRVELSEAGRDFWPYVRRILNELNEAVGSAVDLRDKRKGVLRIAAPQLMACTLLPAVLATYRQQYPDIQLLLHDSLPEQLVGRLQSGEVELVLGPDGDLDQAGFRCHPFLKDRHWLICRSDDPFRKRRRLSWQDLAGRQFIAPTRDFVARMQAVLGQDSESLLRQPWQETSYFTTAFGLVAAGLGVTLSPTYAHALVRAYGLHMVRVHGQELYREVSVYSQPTKQLSPAALAFIACLHRVIRDKTLIPPSARLP